MIASRSPSSVMGAPVVVLMVRILPPEASDGAWLVGVNLDEVLGAGHLEHRFDALLNAGELEVASGDADLPVEIHQASDGRAVHVGDLCEIDQDLALPRRDEAVDGRGKIAQH